MIDFSTIETCFTNIVGFNASANTDCVTALNVANTTSTSGIYVDSLVSGIQLTIIERSLSPDETDINTYLTKIVKAETLTALRQYIAQTKDLTRARDILGNVSFIQEPIEKDEHVTKSGRLVGIKFTPKNSKHVAITLKRLGTQFDTAQTITLYFFCSSQKAAISTQSITTTLVNSLEFTTLTDMIAKFTNLTYGDGQDYYLMYFESDLTGNAVDTNLYTDCCSLPFYTHLDVTGVYFASGDLDGTNLPTIDTEALTDETFGLHAKATVTCDITDIFCDNKNVFANLIGYRVAMRLFEDLYNSDRINRSKDTAMQKVMTNLALVKEDLERELKSLQLDLTGLDRYCMPCKKSFLTKTTLR